MPVDRSQLLYLVRKLHNVADRVVAVLAKPPNVLYRDYGESGEFSYDCETTVKMALHERIALIEARDKITEILEKCEKDGSF